MNVDEEDFDYPQRIPNRDDQSYGGGSFYSQGFDRLQNEYNQGTRNAKSHFVNQFNSYAAGMKTEDRNNQAAYYNNEEEAEQYRNYGGSFMSQDAAYNGYQYQYDNN